MYYCYSPIFYIHNVKFIHVSLLMLQGKLLFQIILISVVNLQLNFALLLVVGSWEVNSMRYQGL